MVRRYLPGHLTNTHDDYRMPLGLRPPRHNEISVGKSSKRHGGRPKIFTSQEQKVIVITCQVLQKMGFGLTREMVNHVIIDYLNDKGRPSPFENNKPGMTGG